MHFLLEGLHLKDLLDELTVLSAFALANNETQSTPMSLRSIIIFMFGIKVHEKLLFPVFQHFRRLEQDFLLI